MACCWTAVAGAECEGFLLTGAMCGQQKAAACGRGSYYRNHRLSRPQSRHHSTPHQDCFQAAAFGWS